MIMSNKTYDILKFIALLILPISEFIGSIATIWKLPFGPEITATLIAVDVLLGAIVKISADKYAGAADEGK